MNPLSPFTYYRRHKRRTALLMGLACLATMGLYLFGGLAQATFIEPFRSNFAVASRLGVVVPLHGNPDPTMLAQIRAHPDVVQVLPTVVLELEVPGLAGNDFDLGVFGLREADVATVMTQCGVVLQEGQMVQPRTDGIVLAEEAAAALDLEVGDTIHSSMDADLYDDFVAPIQVVGLLTGDVRLAIVSYEYLENHELYRDEGDAAVLVIPREGREAVVDDFLVNEISDHETAVFTHQVVERMLAEEGRVIYIFGIPITVVVSLAITLVVGAINRLSLARRLPEFGALHAAGYGKRWLTRRLTLETAVLAVTGWVLGIGLSWVILYVLNLTVYAPHGQDLRPIQAMPLAFVTLIPISVVGFTLVSARRVFSRLDTVAIVERGKLSLEGNQRRTATTSQLRPLTSLTFYKRHKQWAVLLIGAMTLMIMAVSLVVFVLAAAQDAERVCLGEFARMSLVYSLEETAIDPAVAAQIRTHPAVERVILTDNYGWLEAIVPPFGAEGVRTYAVSAEDLAYLTELYGLRLKEGHLPHPRTNKIVIPEAFARNRNLEVGDVLGDPDHPAYPGIKAMPFELVISGIFATPAAVEDQNWLSFMSLEFVTSFRSEPELSLLVVPKAGQKDKLDDWLENEISSSRVRAVTYHQWAARIERETHTLMVTVALLESVIAVAAAVGLAVLNTTFTSQRRSEFGVLHALGHTRPWLVWRTVRETAFATSAAWGLSAVLCLAGLLYLRFGVFDPRGLTLSLANPTPWLFTLPIPVAVVAASAGTIGWALSRLDPVAVIERR